MKTFAEATDGRANNFDFLRFAFAASVIFAHSFQLTGIGFDPITWATRGGTYTGDVAVDGFFAISGALVTASWLRSSGPGDFFKKRILRIFPGFIAATMVCLLIVGPLGAPHLAAYFHGIRWSKAVLDMITLWPVQPVRAYTSFAAQGTLDGPMWSIQPEFWCYILVALLGAIGLLQRRRGLVLAALLICDVLYILAAPQQHGPLILAYKFDYLRCLTCFLTGMTFWLYRDAIPRSPVLCAAAVLGLAGAIAAKHFDYSLAICGGYLLFYGAYNSKWRLDGFAGRGDLSYGLYLYGWPVQIMLVNFLGARMGPYGLFALALPLACLCAALSWRLVESPALRLKTRVPRESSKRPQSIHAVPEARAVASPSPPL